MVDIGHQPPANILLQLPDDRRQSPKRFERLIDLSMRFTPIKPAENQ